MTKTIGLALGSGGVKGIAHIGVIQALLENNVPIHMVSGTSAGAIVGGIYASGTDLNILGSFFSTINSRDFLDMTLPRAGKGGLFKGERMQEMIRLFTHNKKFDETNIPFLCIAVDIEKGERVVFKNGFLHECIRASMSIPGVFMPIRIDGKLCVDGAVLERVPCIPLKEEGADVIIGVDVGYCGEPIKIERPTVRNMMDRTLDIMTWETARLRSKEADIMLYPKVREIMHGFSTYRANECIAEGKRAAMEAMPQILAAIK